MEEQEVSQFILPGIWTTLSGVVQFAATTVNYFMSLSHSLEITVVSKKTIAWSKLTNRK
jgi:hypothetical protein